MNSSRSAVGAIVLVALSPLALSGCLIVSDAGDHVPNRQAPMTFTGFLIGAGDTLHIECLDLDKIAPDGGYPHEHVIDLTYSGGTPYTKNNETLYPVSGSAPLPPGCWSHAPDKGPTYQGMIAARYTVAGDSTRYSVYITTPSCLAQQLKTTDPFHAGIHCAAKFPDGSVDGDYFVYADHE